MPITHGLSILIVGYIALVPLFGVAGAAAVTIAGHAARFALFAVKGQKLIPEPYPAPAIVRIIAMAPPAATAWMLMALGGIGVLAMRLGMLSVIGVGGARHAG